MIDAINWDMKNPGRIFLQHGRHTSIWENLIVIDPSYLSRSLFPTAWKNSRKLILDKLYDVKVDKIGRIPRIISKDVDMGLPDEDKVDVLVNHYELAENGKYRTFLDINVRRRWTLQRLGEGPWRITSVQVI